VVFLQIPPGLMPSPHKSSPSACSIHLYLGDVSGCSLIPVAQTYCAVLPPTTTTLPKAPPTHPPVAWAHTPLPVILPQGRLCLSFLSYFPMAGPDSPTLYVLQEPWLDGSSRICGVPMLLGSQEHRGKGKGFRDNQGLDGSLWPCQGWWNSLCFLLSPSTAKQSPQPLKKSQTQS
jgi:hypothetical protein